MLSKNQTKYITRLQQKKYRQQDGLFIAEGKKTVTELLQSKLEVKHLFVTEPQGFVNEQLITAPELKKISALKTPSGILGIFKIPEAKPINAQQLIVALDDVRDPGNLGTIIRLCDWFGVTQLVCSEATVDCYNPKVIQATMGSITRVNMVYTNLESFLKSAEVPVFGAFMEGDNVYQTQLPNTGVLVMGNEANGISAAVETLITKRISIPRFGKMQATESLNVATATAILLSEFKR